MTRTDITFLSHDTECAGWLYEPDGPGPAPLLVMAHGFSATRELRLDAYAERFRAAGLGVLLFDYRHFGASGGEPRQLLDIRSQQADYRAAVGFARSLDWVDPDRVALFGSSFSGGHVIAVAAADPGIAAVVSQCPFTDGLASLPKLGPANIARATWAGLRDQAGALAGRGPYYVPAVGAPGTFAVMTTPDALPGFLSIVPERTRWENRVAARIGLRVASYRPGLAAARLRCPLLTCVCKRDSVCPPARTTTLVARAPRGEIRHYDAGHFDVYTGDQFEQVVGDQIEFLTRHLLAGHRAGADVASPANAGVS